MGQLPHAARLVDIVQWSGHHLHQTDKRGDHGTAKQALRSHYDRFMAGGERAGLAATRSKLLAHATGDVLEVGAGTGLDLTHYPASARSLILSEPDPAMLRRLERSIAAAADRRRPAGNGPARTRGGSTLRGRHLRHRRLDARAVRSGRPPRTAREIRRVLRPGGRFLFIEHVRSDDDKLARRQDRINWFNRLTTSCDCNRPTLRTLQPAGFVVEDVVHGDLPKLPSFVRPMIVGRATRPAEALAS